MCIFELQILNVKSTILITGKKFVGTAVELVEDALTVEEILNISVNGEPYTMTMRTPGDEEALVRGILLSENVYDDLLVNPTFLVSETNEKGFVTRVNVLIPRDKIQNGIDTKRNLVSVSSCGMCGKSEMELTLDGDEIKPIQKLDISIIGNMFDQMSTHQSTFKNSGGSHACAAFTIDGTLLSIKEDIGRHNAVDKVIGSLLLENQLQDAKCLTVSGRLSYEIVSKCFRAKIPFLAAVSAPSSMAIEYCQKTGITLLAFCRQDRCTVYSHSENIL